MTAAEIREIKLPIVGTYGFTDWIALMQLTVIKELTAQLAEFNERCERNCFAVQVVDGKGGVK